jgi:alpha-L-fucosidase
VNPEAVPYPGASGDAVTTMLQHGDPNGAVWRPAEADVSIRPGWFYHAAEDDRVRPVDDLLDLYFSSVGRNSKLLLNVPPTRDGLLHSTDVARLSGMHQRLTTMFTDDLAAGARATWTRTGARAAEAEVDLGRTVTVRVARLEEDITDGQAVARYTLYGSDGGAWQALSRGTTIGYAKLDRFAPVPVRRARLVINEAAVAPAAVRVRLYQAG